MNLNPHVEIDELDSQTGILRLLLILRDTHDWRDNDKPTTTQLGAILNSITLEKVFVLTKKYHLVERYMHGKKKLAKLTEYGLKVADAVKTIEATIQYVNDSKKPR